MRLDNSQANAFWFCPTKWQHTNATHITEPWETVGFQKKPSGDARDFGKCVHELLKSHFLELKGETYNPPIDANPEIQNEAEELFQSYLAHYPMEDFDVVEVEQYFEVPLPKSPLTGLEHTYCGKRDGVVRDRGSKRLRLLEHKSEARNSRNNLPEVWAARAQVGLYLYAGECDYHEPFGDIILDILTRRSPAGRIPCTFRRDILQRSQTQIDQALQNIMYVADQITMLQEKYGVERPWPQHTENCCKMGFKCDFYQICINSEGQHDPQTLEKYYIPKESYLDL